MPDFSKDQSNKIQVWFKRGYNHNFKVQFIGDPLLRTQVDPILALSGSWQIGKKDFQIERGNTCRSTHKKCNNFYIDLVLYHTVIYKMYPCVKSPPPPACGCKTDGGVPPANYAPSTHRIQTDSNPFSMLTGPSIGPFIRGAGREGVSCTHKLLSA
jgi:hypothetical protein